MKRPVSFGVVFAVMLLATLAASPVYGGEGKASGDVIPGHYIVTLQADASPEGVAQEHGVIRTQTYRYALNGFAAPIPDARLEAVRNDPRVKSVEPDLVVKIDKGPPPGKGPGNGDKEPPPPQALPTGVDRVNADLSGTASIDGVDGRVDVDIAIIDTGIDAKHPDLNVYKHVRCTGTGANTDQNGHGTHVAGTAAALDNEKGVVGVAPGARLWGVKVLDATGSGTLSCVIAGIDYVTSYATEIEVANMSLGCECKSPAMDEAIANSVKAGIVYAVAAGNNAKDAATFSPANHPDVITVSAMADSDGAGGGLGASTSYGADDTFASFSNFGPLVEIAAPGVDILSTWKEGGYNTISGTSMASPHAAGAAALYLAANPGASPAAVRDGILAAGTPQNSAQGFSGDPDSSPEPLLNAGGL